MTNDLLDERMLRDALQSGLPSSSAPPLAIIERRARERSRRRTLRIAGSSAAVAGLALVAAGPLQLLGYVPGLGDDTPICTPHQITYSMEYGSLIEPKDLPDTMRLGWDSSDLPQMQWGNARTLANPCAHPSLHRMIDVADGVVTRTVEGTATPLNTSDAEGAARTDNPAQAEVRNPGGKYLAADWIRDGYQYSIWADGLTVSEMKALLNSVRTSGDHLDTSAWSEAGTFEIASSTRIPPDGTTYSWEVTSERPEGQRVPLTLEVAESTDTLMMKADVGDQLVTVAGHRALQSRDGMITWYPSENVVAFVYGSLGNSELREAAESIRSLTSDEAPTR